MIETEKYCRRKLQVVDLTGGNSNLENVRQKIKDGKPLSFQFSLSALHDDNYYRGWRGSIFPGGGLLYTDFSNDISLLAGIFGAPEEVEGFASNLAHRDTIEFEDAGAVALRTEKGWKGKISWSVNKNEGKQLLVQHAEGVTTIDLQELARREYDDVYERFLHVMSEDLPSNLQEATRTVEAIEKIYKALTPNPA
jgi:predicted dehydrogenase